MFDKNIELANGNKELFVTILEDNINNLEGPLSNLCYVVSDNISTKDILSTGCSNSLSNYVPFYNATVIDKVDQTGATLIGKTKIDELGMGDDTKAAAVVTKDIASFAITSDTGGYLRSSAAENKVVGYKPTYGMISRFGLFAYSSSMDTIGVIAKTVKEVATIVNNVKGIDINDMTSWNSDNIDLSTLKNVADKKLFYFEEIMNEDTSLLIGNLTSKGITVDKRNIDQVLLDAICPVFNIITNAEAVSNSSNITGIPFGVRGEGNSVEEIMINSRTKGFTSSTKEKFVIGAYVLEAKNLEKYLLNSTKVRRILVDTLTDLFKEYDGLIMPTINNGIRHLALANFGGFPSVTLANGLNITSNIKTDKELLNIAYTIEELLKEDN